jgi:hypothetical protein
VKAPHSAVAERIEAARPFLLEEIERGRRPQAVPIVDYVQQVAAFGAGNMDLLDGEGGRAARRNATLKGNIGEGGDANGRRLQELRQVARTKAEKLV